MYELIYYRVIILWFKKKIEEKKINEMKMK